MPRASSTWSPCRRWSAPSCACRTRSPPRLFGGRNWTIVQRARAADPDAADAVAAWSTRATSLHDVPARGRVRRLRRRQLRLVDDQHQRLLPAAAKGWALGLNAGGGNIGVPVDPARRPARHRDASATPHPRSSAPSTWSLLAVAARRRRALHGQPAQPASPTCRAMRRGLRYTRLLGDVASSTSARSARSSASASRSARCCRSTSSPAADGGRPRRRPVAARRPDRVHRPAARLDRPAVRRQARRPASAAAQVTL